MSDVFISYRRDDKAAVHKLVQALRDAKVSVWWDDDIPPDAPWETTTEAALAAAKVVIVCWSPSAILSENVKAEARRARNQGKLIQVFLEPCEPPLFFGERQGVDLRDWSGSEKDERFRSVHEAALAIKDGRSPPRGVGYIPKKRPRWPALFLLPLFLMAFPLALDWLLALRLLMLGGVGWAIWKTDRVVVTSALVACLILNVGLDLIRYRFAPGTYYAVECSIGDINCLTSQSYRFGDRTVRLHPLAGGVIQRLYVSAVAGDRFDRSFFRRERVGNAEALLSPAEMQVLQYLDGGAASKEITIVFQPLSRPFNPIFPWGKAVFEMGSENTPRPDLGGELIFSFGMTATGEESDLFDPAMLRSLKAAAPSYQARRSSPSSLGFAVAIDTRDEPVLWKRAVINDQLFQLYSADNLDEALTELAGDYTSLPDADRALFDALALSYWCTQNRESSAIVACATEASRIAREIARLSPPGSSETPAKIALIRQILALATAFDLGSVAPADALERVTGLSLDAYSSPTEVRQILLRDLLERFPELTAYVKQSDTPYAATNPTPINPLTITDGAFEEYLKGVETIGRTDALQALIPLRRSLAEGFAASTASGADQWGRAIWSDLPGVSLEGKVSASRMPMTFGLMKNSLSGAGYRQKVFERYQRVDAAIAALGGTAPLEIERSRERVKRLRAVELAMNDVLAELVSLLETGGTLEDLLAIADKKALVQTLVPDLVQSIGSYVVATRVAMADLKIDAGRACADNVLRQLSILERSVKQSGARRYITQLKHVLLDPDGVSDFRDDLMRTLGKECADIAAQYETDDASFAWASGYLKDNPLLQAPQEYLAGDATKNGLVSSRQYVLSTTLETIASVANAAEWLAKDDNRVAAFNQRPLFGQALGREDYLQFRDALCSKWREPVWVYPELQNQSVGWRRLPLFFAVLSVSYECDGKPNPQVRAYLDQLLGDKIVDAYLAGRQGRVSRLHAKGRIEPSAMSAIAAMPEWSEFDAYTYAQLLLYRGEYEAFAPYRPAPKKRDIKVPQICGNQPCDPDRRFLEAGLNSYLQSVSSAADLRSSLAESDLFRQPLGIGIDEDMLEELTAQAVPSIATAFAQIREATTSDRFRPIAEGLLRRPTKKEFTALEAIAKKSQLTGEAADRYWIAAHRLFGEREPQLAVAALEHVSADGAFGQILPIRKTVLLLQDRQHEAATEVALDALDRQVKTTDIVNIRLALENARQTFNSVRACRACVVKLAPALFNGFARLDALFGDSRQDRRARLNVLEACLNSGEPAVYAAADDAANAILRPLVQRNKDNPSAPNAADLFDPEFLAANSAVDFAILLKANISQVAPERGNSDAVLFILNGLTQRNSIEPSAMVLGLIRDLAAGAGSAGDPDVATWVERSAKRLARRIAEPGPPDPSFDRDLVALSRLAGPGNPLLTQTLDKLTSQRLTEYKAGKFANISPLRLAALLERAVPIEQWKPEWKLSNDLISRYVNSADYRHLVRSCDAMLDTCADELIVLSRQIAGSSKSGEIVPALGRDLVLEQAQAVVRIEPRRLPTFVAVLAKEFGESSATLTADLLASGMLKEAAQAGDFETVNLTMNFVGTLINESTRSPGAPPQRSITTLNRRLGEILLEDSYEGMIELGCCAATRADAMFERFLAFRLAQPDACGWLETAGVDAAAFVKQKLAGRKDLEKKSPLLAKLRKDPETACAGETHEDRIVALDAKLKSNPNDAASLYARGLEHQARKNYPAAFADFDAAANADRTVASYENARCWYRAVANQGLDVARKACDAAIALNPKAPNIFDSRGMVGLKQERFQEAWNDYNSAVALDGGYASALFGRGIAALRLGRAEEGDADLSAALKLDPGVRLSYREKGVPVLVEEIATIKK